MPFILSWEPGISMGAVLLERYILYYPAISEFITVSKSGRDVHSALGGIARKYGLTYNPNVSLDGVRGAIDPHGLVVGKQENMIPISNG